MQPDGVLRAQYSASTSDLRPGEARLGGQRTRVSCIRPGAQVQSGASASVVLMSTMGTATPAGLSTVLGHAATHVEWGRTMLARLLSQSLKQSCFNKCQRHSTAQRSTGTKLGEPCWGTANFHGFTSCRGKTVLVKPLRINTRKQTSRYRTYSQKGG